jgi:hypothetical protein
MISSIDLFVSEANWEFLNMRNPLQEQKINPENQGFFALLPNKKSCSPFRIFQQGLMKKTIACPP